MNKQIGFALFACLLFTILPFTGIAAQYTDTNTITVTIKTIRSLEKKDLQFWFEKKIDETTDPDFYLKIWIDDQLFESDTYWNTKYLYDLNWQASKQVSVEDIEIPIKIQLWDAADEDISQDRICDLSAKFGESEDACEINLIYNQHTGHWTGDDTRGDPSGYGRLNGCDDRSFYEPELDCELWFDITQNDPDGDGIPSWMETVRYGTDPTVDDTGTDYDNDAVSTEWEWKWGYDPKEYDDHETLDPDGDSLTNWEEYYMRNWDSDPFCVDLFVEMDQMKGPNGEPGMFPEGAKEILYTAYNRQNVVYHLDDGKMGEESRADLIPFDELTEVSWGEQDELDEIYDTYFLNQEDADIRRGIFHYGVVIYQSSRVNGNAFGPNRYQVSALGMENKADELFLRLVANKDIVYASAYMHEMGHSLNFRPIPGHNKLSYYPWQPGFWISRMYKSCMNYGYMFYVVDYSDGSRFFRDFDDWERLDLSYFEEEW